MEYDVKFIVIAGKWINGNSNTTFDYNNITITVTAITGHTCNLNVFDQHHWQTIRNAGGTRPVYWIDMVGGLGLKLFISREIPLSLKISTLMRWLHSYERKIFIF